MKNDKKIIWSTARLVAICAILIGGMHCTYAQDSTAAKKHPLMDKFRAMKPVKSTFNDTYILDNQTVDVSPKRTFEFDLQHRFGVVTNGYKDFIGIFSEANIRLGMAYTPINNLKLGFGFNKYNLTWDFDAKYALMRQSQHGKGIWPLSITVFANMAVDTRDKSNFVNGYDRLSYFGQVLIARKFTESFSVQIGASISYMNNVPGYINADGGVSPLMNNAHFAVEAMGRYKINEKLAILLNYDQPLTQHPSSNPHPNLAAGLEMSTSGHAFQIVFSNYQYIIPQINNFYNQNDYQKGQFCIGFNITRLWHI